MSFRPLVVWQRVIDAALPHFSDTTLPRSFEPAGGVEDPFGEEPIGLTELRSPILLQARAYCAPRRRQSWLNAADHVDQHNYPSVTMYECPRMWIKVRCVVGANSKGDK